MELSSGAMHASAMQPFHDAVAGRLWVSNSRRRLSYRALLVTYSMIGWKTAKLSNATIGVSLAVGAEKIPPCISYTYSMEVTLPRGHNVLSQLSWRGKLDRFQRGIVETSWCNGFGVLDTSVGSILLIYANFLRSVLLFFC